MVSVAMLHDPLTVCVDRPHPQPLKAIPQKRLPRRRGKGVGSNQEPESKIRAMPLNQLNNTV